ncbi:hypothetical protein AB0D83_16380 [Streptomyces decoyicus]|uniref:hypothetical protein n=1 Tax=Streptomyces decoyicus TaxID=249567 RepID=UPI0033FE0795
MTAAACGNLVAATRAGRRRITWEPAGVHALGFTLLTDLALAGGAYALGRMRTAGAATAGKA